MSYHCRAWTQESVAWKSIGGFKYKHWTNPIAARDMWVSLWGKKVNKILIMYISSPSHPPAFCFELFLYSSHTFCIFQTCINKLERRFLLVLAIFSWWMYLWNVCVKHISLKTTTSGKTVIQELLGQKGRKQERSRERELKNLQEKKSYGDMHGKQEMKILTVKLKSQKYILLLSSRHNLSMWHISEYIFCSLDHHYVYKQN